MRHTRPKELTMMDIATKLAQLSTCSRRSVGCVIVDHRYRIIGSGYNGVPSGYKHCSDEPCPLAGSEHGSSCYASHAEANALVQCRDVDQIKAVFSTVFPCIECTKLIMNTSCERVYYLYDYPAHRVYVEDITAGRLEFIDICN